MDNNLSALSQNIANMFKMDQEIPNVPVSFVNQISAWENKSKELLTVPTSEIKTIQDKEFMDCAFKSLVKIGLRALEKMESDLKIGSPAKDKEALAMMQEAVSVSLEKMYQYLFKLQEIEMFQTNANVPQVQNNAFINIEASSSDMMDLVEKAKENSEIRKVEAKFKVDTEKSY